MQKLQLILLTILAACEHQPQRLKEPVTTVPAREMHAVKPPPRASTEKAAAAPQDDQCMQLPKLPTAPPVVIPGKNLVLTKLLRPCVNQAGLRGYERTSPYLAMGFPCTGGSGRIEVNNNPNLIVFLLGTDCGMSPSSRDAAQTLIAQTYDLPTTMKLAAYTPFVVQYWEVAGVSDADVGYVIELRKAPAVEGLWRRFQQKEHIQVRLYGRENTWAQGDNFYSVEGYLKMTGRTAFELEVSKVKSLTKDEIGVIRARCEAIRPRRNCTEVF